MRDNTIENQKAVQKPATLKPGTIFEARMMNRAFITSEKIPRVRMVTGRAISLTTGLIKIFIIPKTTARTTAPKSVTVAPGTRYVAIIMANVETNKCINIFMGLLYHNPM
jgi:hypothetical protein